MTRGFSFTGLGIVLRVRKRATAAMDAKGVADQHGIIELGLDHNDLAGRVGVRMLDTHLVDRDKITVATSLSQVKHPLNPGAVFVDFGGTQHQVAIRALDDSLRMSARYSAKT